MKLRKCRHVSSGRRGCGSERVPMHMREQHCTWPGDGGDVKHRNGIQTRQLKCAVHVETITETDCPLTTDNQPSPWLREVRAALLVGHRLTAGIGSGASALMTRTCEPKANPLYHDVQPERQVRATAGLDRHLLSFSVTRECVDATG